MTHIKRRNFVKAASISALSCLLPFASKAGTLAQTAAPISDSDSIYLINSGILYRPEDYLKQLQLIQQQTPITRDFYGAGGTMKTLLDKFCEITGKEAAIYMPSGTLANQLAIHTLAADNPKVMVQESSHVYRDEADAAQTIFNKRLIPLGKGQANFSLEELQQSIAWHKSEEAFDAPVGAVSIETPVRRFDCAYFPLEEIRKITTYCREQGIKTHLDGARLHIAAAYTKSTVLDYAKNFDTVYMCLYKYLGAQGGAVLCGDKSLIDKMHHLTKVHGGGIFTNWSNAAMALYHLERIDKAIHDSILKSNALFKDLNQLSGIQISPMKMGTNIFNITYDKSVDTLKMVKYLRGEAGIILGQPKADRIGNVSVNETILRRDNAAIVTAFSKALKA